MNLMLKGLQSIVGKHISPLVSEEMTRHVPADVAEYPDIRYYGEDGVQLAADIYRPMQGTSTGKLPTAIMVHGGGFFTGSRKVNRLFCEMLARKGFIVFAPDYRLLDEADACGAIADICAGFDFVRGVLEKYGGDPERVCVIGESAGAFLSIYATALARSKTLSRVLGCPIPVLKPTALICFSGMFYTTDMDIISMVYKKDMYGDRRRDRAFMALMDPGHDEVISSLPPVLLTSSKGDFLRSYTLRYAKTLERVGHPCELIYFSEGKQLGHGFPSLDPSLPESMEVMEKMIAWLDTLNK